MNRKEQVEIGYHVPKLTLLEVWPLNPFIGSKENLSVVDIGGNIGLWAQAFLNVFGEQVKQYQVFEPLPGNVNQFKMRLNTSLKHLSEKVKLKACAVGNQENIVKLHFDSEISTIASVPLNEIKVGQKIIKQDKVIDVEQITIDTWSSSSEGFEPDIIKIDVEGYEWEVLEGTQNLMNRRVPSIIYYEFSQHQADRGQTFLQFWEFFRERDYHIYRQNIGRNFFGFQYISEYKESLEEFNSMWMVCASKEKHDPRLNIPYVIGNYK